MVEGCERNFKNRTNWRHVIGTTEAESGQESKAFHTEEWWIVQNGWRQQTTMMFDNNKSIDGDERIAWRSFMRAFSNWNNIEENIGC